jgi:hypothetical protein
VVRYLFRGVRRQGAAWSPQKDKDRQKKRAMRHLDREELQIWHKDTMSALLFPATRQESGVSKDKRKKASEDKDKLIQDQPPGLA